jgi:hypothetical protein
MNRAPKKLKVCQTVEETVYSGKLYRIFNLLGLKVGPSLDIVIQKIWEKDIDTINNHQDFIQTLSKQLQTIKKHVNRRQKSKEFFSEDLEVLWVNIVPVIEGTIEHILNIYNQSDSENFVVPQEYKDLQIELIQEKIQMLFSHNKIYEEVASLKMPIIHKVYMPQITKIFELAQSGSYLEAQEMISAIEDVNMRIHIIIQMSLRAIEKKDIDYALHLLGQVECMEVSLDRDIRYTTMATVSNMKKILKEVKIL